jgi:cyclic dehypoxanthinyl futalosine synthase
MGYKTAQEGLHNGADDFGSVIMEENVVTAAGIPRIYPNEQKVCQLITEAGFRPQQRDTMYCYVTSRQNVTA